MIISLFLVLRQLRLVRASRRQRSGLPRLLEHISDAQLLHVSVNQVRDRHLGLRVVQLVVDTVKSFLWMKYNLTYTSFKSMSNSLFSSTCTSLVTFMQLLSQITYSLLPWMLVCSTRLPKRTRCVHNIGTIE